MTTTATRLSRVLRNHRYAERVTEKELAAAIGISTTMLNRLERGEAVGGEGLLQVFRWLIAPDPIVIL